MVMTERAHTAATIQRDVQEQLTWEPMLESAGIGVAVTDDCVVTLTGHVRSFAEKQLAERLAKKILGVRAVANDLYVRLPDSSLRDDTDIAEATVRALEWNAAVPADRIQVTVQDGWVALYGDVEWRYQREAAERAVEHLIGVKGVTNAIRTASSPAADPTRIRSRIEAALKRSAEIDARHIRVDVSDGRVVLSGTVRSWAEREDAERAAWSGSGVGEVENRIIVEARSGAAPTA